ncbi:MAG: amino acid permease [Candidatus Hydrogenedens sp.]|nr:amino acid permease [Candidatus Hydrogenedens sp.]
MSGSGQQAELKRNISLAGAVALVVGAVIGAGIYVMIGAIGHETGSALWLAFLVAMLMSLVGVIPLIQLAGSLPRDGAGYFFSSRMINPFIGTLVSYWVILGAAASTCVVSLTLGVYLQPVLDALIPVPVSLHVAAVVVCVLFWVIYLFGVQLAMSLQVVMAAQFVTALTLYAVVGLTHVTLDIGVTPPYGMPAFLTGILLCYSTCMGFQVIAEMGEEVINARRNIPLALLLGGAIVALIYIVVGQVYMSHFPNHPEVEMDKTVTLSATAESFMPPWMLWFLGLGAFTAGFTSLNAAAIALPREFFAQARDGLLPEWFGRISPRTHAPQNSVTVFFVFVCLMLLTHQDKDFYGLAAAIGILVMSAVLCIASLRLHKLYPEHYHSAYIVFPYPVLAVCTTLTVLISLFFGAVVISEAPVVAAVYGAWTVLVCGWYFSRTRGWTAEDWARTKALGVGEGEEPVEA